MRDGFVGLVVCAAVSVATPRVSDEDPRWMAALIFVATAAILHAVVALAVVRRAAGSPGVAVAWPRLPILVAHVLGWCALARSGWGGAVGAGSSGPSAMAGALSTLTPWLAVQASWTGARWWALREMGYPLRPAAAFVWARMRPLAVATPLLAAVLAAVRCAPDDSLDAVAARYPATTFFGLATMVAIAALGAPAAMRIAVASRPLGAERSARLRRIACAAGQPRVGIRVVDTDRGLRNAAVVGACGRWRDVYLTDGLLRDLAPTELEAVFAHELGHGAGRHGSVMAALGIGWLGVVLGVASTVDGWPLAAGVIATGVGFAVLVRSLAVGFEHDADVRASGFIAGPNALIAVLNRTCETPGGRSLLHPSPTARVRVLQALEAPRSAAENPCRPARRLAFFAVALAVLAAASFALRLPAEVASIRAAFGSL